MPAQQQEANGDSLTEGTTSEIFWSCLPANVRLNILQILARQPGSADQKHRPLYASVSSEWQSTMERETFKTLTVSSDDLPEFKAIFKRSIWRQASLEHLILQIQLKRMRGPGPRVMRKRCPYQDEYEKHYDADFAISLDDFFSVLRKWKADEVTKRRSGDLTVQISTDSSRVEPVNREMWKWSPFPPMGSQGRIPGARGLYGLPGAEVVTRLSISRRSAREISMQFIAELSLSLVRLEHLHIEAWHRHGPETWERFEYDLYYWVPILSRSVRKLSISNYGDVIETPWVPRDDYEAKTYPPLPPTPPTRRPRRTELSVATAFAKSSFQLEELAVCNLMEAQHFFNEVLKCRGGPPTWGKQTWDSLKVLTLTSNVFKKTENPTKINALLQTASEVAKQMPNLQVMELYNAGKHDAGIFQFKLADSEATIRWKSTWYYTLSKGVERAWRTIVRKRNPNIQLQTVSETISRGYAGPMDFIHSNSITQALAFDPFTLKDLLALEQSKGSDGMSDDDDADSDGPTEFGAEESSDSD